MREDAMNNIFKPNQTSASLMVQVAAAMWNASGGESDSEPSKRYALIYDLYIKARSYAIINKLAFWFALFAAVMVLAWPSVVALVKVEVLQSAVIQTSITGLAALTFAVYAHYKKRQLYMENLMRRAIYSEDSDQDILTHVLAEMERIDSGFAFSDAAAKKGK
jgi:hypothetical protein